MPEKVSITKTKLDNLANAISAKSGEPLNLTIDEMEAAVNGINIGEENILEGVKVNGVELPIDSQKKVNIPAVSENKAGVMTPSIMDAIYINISEKADKSEIPNRVSQLANDSGFINNQYIGYLESGVLYIPKGWDYNVGASGYVYLVPFYVKGNNNNISSSTKIRTIQTSTDLITFGPYYLDGESKTGTTQLSTNTLYLYKYSDSISYIYTISKKNDIPTKTSDLTNDSNFVVDSNYVHTDNNFTTALKNKLDGVASGAEVNVQSDWNISDSSSDAFIKNKPSIPTKVSDLTNDSNYQTDTEVETAITDALAGVVGFSIEIVNSLPATGDAGVFYFVPNSGEQDNIYDEYLYVNNAWEKLGTTEIDLSNYLQKTDISAWAKEPNKPTYTAQEVGALPNTTTYVSSFNGSTGNITYTAPVTSVNNQTGDVSLSIPDSTSDLTNDSGFITSASLPTKVSDLTNDSGYITNSEEDDPVFTASAAYGIQSSDITNWNNKSDFSGNYNDLTNKPTIPTVPTNVSAFTNDAGYLTSYTETDPIFSASPAAGITGSNITNWNNYYKVRQENVSNDAIYPVLLGYQVGDVAVTEKTLKSSNNFNFNPSTGNLKATTFNSYTLKGACAKAVDTSISTGSSSTDLPTSAAVANFVENKGYLTLEDLPIYDGTVV